MIVSINQPAYLPWLGYFDRIAKSDIHIILDHVQYEKNSFINRNKIRTPESWTWLTLPVLTKGNFGKLNINSLKINTTIPWRKKHWRTIKANYSNAHYFHNYSDFFCSIYDSEWFYLHDVVYEINNYLLTNFNISTKIIYSSELHPHSSKSKLVLELCQKTGATKYISGPLGRHYLDTTLFLDAGIELAFHDYPHPTYKQNFKGFEPYMSAIDLLFNYGPESRKKLISPETSLNFT